MIYAHEELMHELGLHQSELPNHIAVQYRAFAQKKRLSTKPEALEKLIETSEELADEIATWHVAYVSEDEDEEDEEEDEDENPAPAPIIKKEKTQIVTHVSNNEIEDDEEEEDEERDERWGSKRGNW